MTLHEPSFILLFVFADTSSTEWWLTVFTGALVLVTAVLAAVAFLQFLAMRRQESWMQRSVEVAETSAKAAKESADALIGSERAWIMVQVTRVPVTGGLIAHGQSWSAESGLVETTSIRFRMTCKNEGHTPAWITERRYCLKILSGTPPTKPNFNDSDEIQNDPEPLASGQATDRDLTVTVTGQEQPGQITILYGVLKYRDIFADNRETTFGYAITSDNNRLERLIGLADYNKNT
jgi:hypothetical protein